MTIHNIDASFWSAIPPQLNTSGDTMPKLTHQYAPFKFQHPLSSFTDEELLHEQERRKLALYTKSDIDEIRRRLIVAESKLNIAFTQDNLEDIIKLAEIGLEKVKLG